MTVTLWRQTRLWCAVCRRRRTIVYHADIEPSECRCPVCFALVFPYQDAEEPA